MNNTYIESIKEFRRFANTYIYPETVYTIIEYITDKCEPIQIIYNDSEPQLIKFKCNTKINNQAEYTIFIHGILKSIFMNYFNREDIAALVRNKIHTELQDEQLKWMLRSTLAEIQSGNIHYLALLFNITLLNDGMIYLYL